VKKTGIPDLASNVRQLPGEGPEFPFEIPDSKADSEGELSNVKDTNTKGKNIPMQKG
jgi:hypothetical protein